MIKKTFALILGLAMLASSGAGAAPLRENYESTPFWLDGQTVPLVMLVLERDWKIFYPAYNNLTDLDGDGVIDVGFNPAVTYVGYFDSDSCYSYSTSSGVFARSGPAIEQTTAEAAALVPDIIKAQGRDIYKYDETTGERVSGQDGLNDIGIKAVRSKHGVCDRGKSDHLSTSSSYSTGDWHGNWLNFATTSRMDAIRKVLYGGKRQVDETGDKGGRTVLELTSYLPANGHVWGGELVADDLWADYARSSVWYDIPSFTGYPAPDAGKMHFWARSSYYTPNVSRAFDRSSTFFNSQAAVRTYSAIPLFQFAANIPSTNFHPRYATPLRIWDWVGDHGGGTLPNDWNLVAGPDPTAARAFAVQAYSGKQANVAARRFNARVEVCQKDNMGENEGCREYGPKDAPIYKPAGLLQQYGETEKMFFGLLTGSLHYNATASRDTRYEGGVVRHHIQKFSNYVNVDTDGTVIRPSLIDTIDRLQVTGIGGFAASAATPSTANSGSYVDGSQAGNPLGEMVYEAVRYLSRRADTYLTWTDSYQPVSEVILPQHSNNLGSRTLLPKLTKAQWTNRTDELSDAAEDCPKPVILVLSEVYPDHDANTSFPSQSDFNNTPLLSPETSQAPATFSVAGYLDLISDTELYKTSAEGKQFFYPNQKAGRGVCEAQDLANGLIDVQGHCPSEPSLEGGYSLAAIAYYAHTHNMFRVGGATASTAEKDEKITETGIDTYAVGIPGNFPDITFKVDETHSLTVMPITVALSYAYNDTGAKLRTLINFFVDSWEVDINGRPYKAKFATNFEYNTTPAFATGTSNGTSGSNNMERDVFNRFEITLLTTKNTPPAYREPVPTFINSGRFRTQDDVRQSNSRWKAAKNKWINSGYTDTSGFDAGDNNGRPYYYAFRDPSYSSALGETDLEPLDISQFEIVGVAIKTATLGSYINMKGHGGYTISGVTRPGAYIDAGYYGSDAYSRGCKDSLYYSQAATHKNEPVIMDGDYLFNDGVRVGEVSASVHTSYPDRRGLPPGLCNPYHPDDLLTPWECPFSGYTDANRRDQDVIDGYGTITLGASQICGYNVGANAGSSAVSAVNAGRGLMRYVQVRSFEFDEHAPEVVTLKNPLWLAAKYGGFKDSDVDGLPSHASEWKRDPTGGKPGDDDPYNYFGVANMSQLPQQLGEAFATISSSVGTGTANSSSLNTVLGGGLAIQTQYRTRYPETGGLTWVGSVSALFVDKWGNLRADTNIDAETHKVGDKKLQLKTSDWSGHKNGEEIGDLIVHQVSQAEGVPKVFLCRDPNGDNNNGFDLPTNKMPRELDPATGEPDPNKISAADKASPDYDLWNGYPPTAQCEQVASMDNVPAVWNAAEELAKKVAGSVANRNLYTYVGNHAADGSDEWIGVDGELGEFKAGAGNDEALHKYMGQEELSETLDLVNYIRGQDFEKYRSRTADLPWGGTGVWPMGDVLNSKPVIVGEPNGRYNLNYGDRSYSGYASGDTSRGGVATRRQVVYFGSNSGVLHAVNLGYFGSLESGQAGYTQAPGKEELGEELWGYIPTAVLPHLQWLADPDYRHSYYVDLQPNIVDIKDSKGEWRTVMIVGLRLGGNTIELFDSEGNRTISYSEYFAMDITDPDQTPSLLWRFSAPYLGLTTSTPAVVRSGDDWYVVLPSGPTSDVLTDGVMAPNPKGDKIKAYAGTSTQKARVFILEAMTGKLVGDPNTNPNLVVEEENSFFNNTFVSKAYEANVIDRNTENTTWSHHVVYMGLSVAENNPDKAVKENYGAVYRLQMANDDGTIRDINDTSANGWRLARMINTEKPVSGAVNSTYDNVGNLWVVFGTGRTWDKDDLIPCGSTLTPECCDNHTQYIYGLKEPLKKVTEPRERKGSYITFAEIGEKGAECGEKCENDLDIVEVTGVNVYADETLEYSATNNLGFSRYNALYDHMVAKDGDNPVVRGYKRKLETWSIMRDVSDRDLSAAGLYEAYREFSTQDARIFELINTQPQIIALGNGASNTAVTVYQTNYDICNPLGQSYLYLYDTFTGLPSPDMKDYYGMDVGATNGNGSAQMTGSAYIGPGLGAQATVTRTETGLKVTGQAPTSKADIKIPGGVVSGFMSWREVMDMDFEMEKGGDALFKDLL